MMAFRFRYFAGAAAIGALTVLGCGGAYLGFLQLHGNFDTVVSDELYRSAQITPQRLDDYAARYGIKTVVNLRGRNPGAPWYLAETAEAQKLGIVHLDFRLSARREVTAEQASELIALLQSAPKPILIHCKSGADRTGLASALYLAAVKSESPALAARQLSIRYGHLSLPFISEYAMDRSFEKLEASATRESTAP